MKRALSTAVALAVLALSGQLTVPSVNAWFDETHVAVAKAAGYAKWFNTCGPDMIKEKTGEREAHYQHVNNPRGSVVTPEMVMAQVEKYDQVAKHGHLYGAIIATARDYNREKRKGKYAEYHLAFCAHYLADLSQPLHNIEYSPFNKRYHKAVDGVVNDEVLENLDKIKVYPLPINSEEDLAKEIARVANLSMVLGYRLEDENRILRNEEAYEQLGHSASLFKAVLDYVKRHSEN